jgi:N-acetylglucosamine kinase-like BadF-type ATPase
VSACPVLGFDVGGTWTRALAVDAATGTRLGAGRAAGANPVAHGVARAAGNVGAALTEALAGRDPAGVRGCVVGMAGAGKVAADPAAAAAFAELWHEAGLRCPVEIVSDVAAAFAAGTAQPDGSVLLAGTGAVAAAVADRRPRHWRDGYGWLLGDEGSGFWIGRQAVRAALAALEGREPQAALAEAVLAAYPGPNPHPAEALREPERARLAASALIAAVTARPPVELSALVPSVLSCARAGDPAAARILAEAGERLVAALGDVRAAGDASPIVLAGGVLGPGSPVARLVREALAASWPDAPVSAATDGAAGAAWLAALPLLAAAGHDAGAAAILHTRLMTEGGTGDARTRRG